MPLISRNYSLVLHNIRSVHNVGSIFRSADAAGISRIILSGYTPGPLDRFGNPRKDFTKVSLGAEKSVPWIQKKTIASVLKELKKENCFLVAVEQDARSTSLFDFQAPNKPLAVVMGNEVRGVSPQVLKQCDAIVEIPMRGKKESLNVSVAAGIALFTLLHK
ncbi:TrmH family RNA methyltransferase [Acetobacteraceae bacterium]|nr:TrmH family RNA methyltransferase [Candidatus Parcubacteria bacterium]